MYLFFCEIVDTHDTTKKGGCMTAKNSKAQPLKATRWAEDEWAWLAEVAKSVGLTRSGFIRVSTLAAARAAAAGIPPYYVSGALASPHNTRPNHFNTELREQVGGEVGGERSRTRLNPEDFSGQAAEQIGREGGNFPTGSDLPKAVQAKAKLS